MSLRRVPEQDPPYNRRRAGRVLSDPPKWYSGALHLHTIHSDGVLTPAALADAARDAGYDFIAITDHNNTTTRAIRFPPRRCTSSARK